MNYYGDYLGFRFGNYHSRDLGLYRVSEGDRYTDASIPNFTDTTQKVPGGDGTYYWDSFYTSRTFTINTVFDNLSETQLHQIKQIFNGKAEDWLVFDEVPYKKYRAKLQSPPQIKYLTFREGVRYISDEKTFEKQRVHKGEITFQFISYSPYAIDNFKTYDYVPQFDNDDTLEPSYPNIDEWYESIPLLSKANYDALTTNTSMGDSSGAGYFVYNPGDLATNVKITLNWNAVPSNLKVLLKHRVQMANRSAGSSAGDITISQLNFNNFAVSSSDTHVVIDTARNLVYGVNYEGKQTGTLYNKYMTSGEFFKIPITQEMDTSKSSQLTDYCDYIWVNVPRPNTGTNCALEYSYLYY